MIELEFRDQFEIAKACDEYKKLVEQLPVCYVGKADYLKAIVGVMCGAAKRSMEEKKLHMGPWRKRSFMQMKWSNTSERRSIFEPSNKLSLVSSRQVHRSCLKLFNNCCYGNQINALALAGIIFKQEKKNDTYFLDDADASSTSEPSDLIL